jgi:hypothetical protein
VPHSGVEFKKTVGSLPCTFSLSLLICLQDAEDAEKDCMVLRRVEFLKKETETLFFLLLIL